MRPAWPRRAGRASPSRAHGRDPVPFGSGRRAPKGPVQGPRPRAPRCEDRRDALSVPPLPEPKRRRFNRRRTVAPCRPVASLAVFAVVVAAGTALLLGAESPRRRFGAQPSGAAFFAIFWQKIKKALERGGGGDRGWCWWLGALPSWRRSRRAAVGRCRLGPRTGARERSGERGAAAARRMRRPRDALRGMRARRIAFPMKGSKLRHRTPTSSCLS